MSTTVTEFKGEAAVVVACWCSIQFAIPQSLYETYARNNAQQAGSFSLHCPLGHEMVPAKSGDPLWKLKDELAREKHRREQEAAHAEHLSRTVALRDRQLAARKGQITKIRKRIEKGVCPCCNRYFANLHRHMESQHPTWAPDAGPESE